MGRSKWPHNSADRGNCVWDPWFVIGPGMRAPQQTDKLSRGVYGAELAREREKVELARQQKELEEQEKQRREEHEEERAAAEIRCAMQGD